MKPFLHSLLFVLLFLGSYRSGLGSVAWSAPSPAVAQSSEDEGSDDGTEDRDDDLDDGSQADDTEDN